MSRTVATLEISSNAFNEIADKLRAAGYNHLFMVDGSIDMYGIGLACAPKPTGPVCSCNSRSGPDYCEVHAA
ncbi:hypothetical protein [Paraburkholderia caribensis]|uniref:hypothetical protein n=1 Tax=Paraburkholderia caribensis TaxID=75105 RepID=UPI001CAF2FE8|nr:hypothetical protein [Paraburkholderia caribensis]CAG9256076.1 conserved hypothetical protein [Paraburkholderia caribensis]